MTDETQGWFTFKTATARCRGHVQLRDGRAYILLTAMVELIGHEEIGGARRPDGIEHRAEEGSPHLARPALGDLPHPRA